MVLYFVRKVAFPTFCDPSLATEQSETKGIFATYRFQQLRLPNNSAERYNSKAHSKYTQNLQKKITFKSLRKSLSACHAELHSENDDPIQRLGNR